MTERPLTPLEVRMMFAAQDTARLEAEARGQSHILADEQIGMDRNHPTILGHRGIYKRRDGTMYYQTGYIRREQPEDDPTGTDEGRLYGYRYAVVEMISIADVSYLSQLRPNLWWIVMADCAGNDVIFVCNRYVRSMYT
jgi:hypothetical protein